MHYYQILICPVDQRTIVSLYLSAQSVPWLYKLGSYKEAK